MAHVLITGAGGQIGADLMLELVARGHRVTATDLRPKSGIVEMTTPGISWETLDVTNAESVESVIATARPDWVIHLAAILSATGEKHPTLAYDVNQTGTWNVLEASRKNDVARVIFTSSIAVFGPLAAGLPDPTPDEVCLQPTTIYGATKAAGELLCDYYRRRWRMDVRGLRFPGLISASLPGGGSSDYALFMYVDGVRKGAYQAFCRPDTRIPLMYMPDGVRALLELSLADRAGLSRTIYNVAGFSPRADQIAASVGQLIPSVNITYAPDPVRQGILDSWPKALDDQKAYADWGWRAAYGLDAMTTDLIPRVREMLARGVDLSH